MGQLLVRGIIIHCEETLVGDRKMGGRTIAKKSPEPVKSEWPEVKNATWRHKRTINWEAHAFEAARKALNRDQAPDSGANSGERIAMAINAKRCPATSCSQKTRICGRNSLRLQPRSSSREMATRALSPMSP